VEDCWDHIRSGSQSFGFHEVRMSLSGRVFEETSLDSAKPRWQLRIPLPNSQYVNFSRDFDSDLNPLVLSAFVEAVQRGLEARSLASATEVIRMPALNVRHYSAAANSGGNGDLKRAVR
jgi:hypothetical protein